jgi:outer membrane protein assembly factor BamB
MKFRNTIAFFLLLLVTGFVAAQTSNPATTDWPQWRGPNRDGISKETGLLKTWPEDGLNVIWKSPIGAGYSSLAISQGHIYTMDSAGKDEFVVCLDQANGKEIWRTITDAVFDSDQGDGPRSTPTVDGNWVYAIGANGMLVALNAKDGKKVWSHDLRKEFESEIPRWGTSTSPIVEKDLLLVDVGGKTGFSLMAFNKKDGTIVWKSHTDKQGYSSPIAITIGGIRQIVFFTGTALVSVSPKGDVYWKYPWRTDYDANIATPLFIPPDKIFISSSYGTGAAVVKVAAADGKATVSEVWKNKVMENHFNSSVLNQGYIYGFDNAVLKCIDANTGAEKWKKTGFGKGSLILADNHLIVLGERGQLALIEVTPSEYKEVAQTQIMSGKTWTMPSLAGKKLYLRDQKQIVALDLAAK